MAEGSNKLFRRSDIAKSNHSKDAKIIINNSVYDVTNFLNEHPGGEEVLLEQAGKDGTEAFIDISHSTDARELMKKYKLGDLVPDEATETVEKKIDWSSSKSEDDQGSWKSWMIPVGLAIIASIIYRFYFFGSSH